MTVIKIRDILEGNFKNEKVTIRGWVYRKRTGKDVVFLVLRDSTGIIQSTVKKTSPAWDQAEQLTIESSLKLEGTAKEDKRAPGGYEISADNIEMHGNILSPKISLKSPLPCSSALL